MNKAVVDKIIEFRYLHGALHQYLKGTVSPDYICLKIEWLNWRTLGHKTLAE
jgi:hypothetical protein